MFASQSRYLVFGPPCNVVAVDRHEQFVGLDALLLRTGPRSHICDSGEQIGRKGGGGEGGGGGEYVDHTLNATSSSLERSGAKLHRHGATSQIEDS